MRSKEYAHDYRYFPEPDLLPLVVDAGVGRRGPRRAARAARPRAATRFVRDYGLSPYDADVLTQRKDVADYFEAGVAAGAPREGDGQLGHDRAPAHRPRGEARRRARHPRLAGHAGAAREARRARRRPGTINRNTAKGAHPAAPRHGTRPRGAGRSRGPRAGERPRRARGGGRATSSRKHPAQVAEFKAGKERVLGFLVGQVMKATGGKANPQLVRAAARRARRRDGMTRAEAEAFARRWIAVWNARDLDTMLGFFAEDVRFHEPARDAPDRRPVVTGKPALGGTGRSRLPSSARSIRPRSRGVGRGPAGAGDRLHERPRRRTASCRRAAALRRRGARGDRGRGPLRRHAARRRPRTRLARGEQVIDEDRDTSTAAPGSADSSPRWGRGASCGGR